MSRREEYLRSIVHEHTCPYCGEVFLSEKSRPLTRCSASACVSAQLREQAAPRIAAREEEKRKARQARQAVIKRVREEVMSLRKIAARKAKVRVACEECGSAFMSNRENARFCNQQCSRRAYRRADKAKRRSHKRGEYVGLVAVFRRDRWHCQECGVHTPRESRGTHESYAPELDHILPLSQGGRHTWSNVQLLCRECNGSKGDSMPDEWHTSPYGDAPPLVLSERQAPHYAA